MNPKLSTDAANVEADAVAALLNGGRLRIYDGVQPLTANAAVSDQVLLAELAFADPAFGAAEAGAAAAHAITEDIARASGMATWFRTVSRAGARVYDGDVGTSASDLNLTSVHIVAGDTVQVTALTFTASRM